jgi:RNA polymerase sigma-70 factor, ECF subfamily
MARKTLSDSGDPNAPGCRITIRSASHLFGCEAVVQAVAAPVLCWARIKITTRGRKGVPRRSVAPPHMTGQDGRVIAPERLGDLLIAVAQSQDRDAFEILFEHFAPRLKAYVLRQGTDAGMAEEVVQETMVKVWRRAAQFQPERASAATWVFTIARNTRIDMLRKARRPEPDMNDPAYVSNSQPPVDEAISRAQDAERLRKALASLPAEQQTVLIMAFFEDKPHARVAEELGLPLGTVKSRIRLAVRRIQSKFGGTE